MHKKAYSFSDREAVRFLTAVRLRKITAFWEVIAIVLKIHAAKAAALAAAGEIFAALAKFFHAIPLGISGNLRHGMHAAAHRAIIRLAAL